MNERNEDDVRWILGTRGSLLATTQSGHVADALRRAAPGVVVELREIRTEGDRLQTVPLAPGEKLAKGLFTSALEDALRRGEIDFAVHSLKDVPTALAEGLRLAAIPEREDPRDAFLSNGPTLRELPAGSSVATGSPRRAFQLQRLRPDLRIVPVRGNVDTRIRKLRDREFDGLVLALSGLRRLGREGEVTEVLSLEDVLPAPGQGALAIETRDDPRSRALDALLDHPPTRRAVAAERAVLTGIGGGCNLPLGTWARVEGDVLVLDAVLFREDGGECARTRRAGPADDPEGLGRAAAEELLRGLAGAPGADP